jgi:excisionase family DNA binding protein
MQRVCRSSTRWFLVAFELSAALSEVMHENTSERTERADRVLLLTIVEGARVLSIGRTTMYELVRAGNIDVVHIGRSARVPVAALEQYVERLRAEGATVRPARKSGPGQAGT